MALSVAERAAQAARRSSPEWRSCIFLLMTGGPSQLDTFDPKPEAPADIRGPVRAIPTAVPGMLLAELPIVVMTPLFRISVWSSRGAAPVPSITRTCVRATSGASTET